ncbi:hypothetical protein FBUS_02912 [Fasciolopsis buskii]|uniref:Uncharacterized protein n=1 Tax=Fasciolopsis buskii TaxID=27845 RepID=A0A8E0VKW8_9TREM|nr:hypothetical protein FBUS_02912 [Fasciolopsis buski]
MVRLTFYEQRGCPCKQVVKENGRAFWIAFHETDSWPFPTSGMRWYLRFFTFSSRWCRVTQISCGGTKKHSTIARAKFVDPNSALIVTGRFGNDVAAQRDYPHFCLYLSTKVTDTEFHNGSILSGSLQRGNRRRGVWETTHYAFVKRTETGNN